MGEGEDVGEVMSLLCVLQYEGNCKNCRDSLTQVNAVFPSVKT